MKFIHRFFPSESFAYYVTILAGGTAVGQMAGVLAAPLLARIYTPEDFGVLGVFLSLFSILNVISSLRYEYVINLVDDTIEAAQILGFTLILVVAFSILLLFIVLLFSQPISDWLNTPSLASYLWLLPLSILGAGLYTAFNYWGLRQAKFAAISRTRVTQSLSNTVVSIVAGLLVHGAFGLLFAHAVSQSIGSSTLSRLSWQQNKSEFSKINQHGMIQTASRHARLALVSTVSALINTIGGQLPRLLLSLTFDVAVTGAFTFGQRIFAIPIGIVGVSVGQVFLSKAGHLSRENPLELRRLYFKTTKQLMLLGLIPTIALMLFGAPIFSYIFGKQWEIAGIYTQFLAPTFFLQFVVSSVSQVLIVLKRASIQLVWDIVRLISIGSLFLGIPIWGLDDQVSMQVYSLVNIILYVILFFVQWRLLDEFVQKGSIENEPTEPITRDTTV